MKKRVILNVIWGSEPGGVTSYFKLISSFNSDDKDVVNVIFQKSNRELPEEFKDERIYKVIYYNALLSPFWVLSFKRVITEINPHVVFTHAFNGVISAFITSLFIKNKIKLLYSFHGNYIAPSLSKKMLQAIYNRSVYSIFRWSDCKVICVSNFSKKQLIDKHCDPNKIFVIHNALPKSKILSERQFDASKLKCCVVSRISPGKGINVVLNVFKKRSNSLTVIGDGPLLEALSIEASSYDNIEFVGKSNEVEKYLLSCDVFILPSSYENHSIAILEAMRASNVIIVTDVGGNAESIRHNKDGILFDNGDEQSLNLYLDIIEQDRALCKRLSTSASVRFDSNFTIEKFYRNLNSIFEQY